MTDLIVQKFGGSSVSTPEQIRAIAQKVGALYRQGKKLIVVVSAMGKSTDQLLELARKVSPHPNRRELDMLLSTGERVSMALMSMALHDQQCPSISFTGSQAGVFTDGSFSNARITELKPLRVDEALKENKVVVLAGFQGVDPKTKEITTLGRGGSDTTAVAMAAHFKAGRCEILKDVDGVFSADPRIVPEAQLHARLPVEALYEFCFWGAKVLNYRSVEWARQHRVPLFVGRSDNFSIGTEIVNGLEGFTLRDGELLGVNSHAAVLEIAVDGRDTADACGTLDQTLFDAGLPPANVLQTLHKSGSAQILVAADADTLGEMTAAFDNAKSIRILQNRVSTVTATYSKPAGFRSETRIVPATDRERTIREVFAQ